MKPFSIGLPMAFGPEFWYTIMDVDGERFLRTCNERFRYVTWTKIDQKEINYGNGTKKTSGIQERAE